MIVLILMIFIFFYMLISFKKQIWKKIMIKYLIIYKPKKIYINIYLFLHKYLFFHFPKNVDLIAFMIIVVSFN